MPNAMGGSVGDNSHDMVENSSQNVPETITEDVQAEGGLLSMPELTSEMLVHPQMADLLDHSTVLDHSTNLEMNEITENDVHHDLDQVAVIREMRALEISLAEEKQRCKDNKAQFDAKLKAQRQAHVQDIMELEDMVKNVMAENKRLASIVTAWEERARAGSSSSGTPLSISSTSSVTSRRGKIQETESTTSASTSSLPRSPELNRETLGVGGGSDTVARSDDSVSSISDEGIPEEVMSM